MFSCRNVRQLGIVVDCWQFTSSYEIFKTVFKSPYKDKSLVLISNFFQLEIELTVRNVFGLTLMTCPGLKQIKSENNSLSNHLRLYRLGHIRSFIHPSLGIIYGFRLDASETMLWYTHIQLHVTLFIQNWNDISCIP